MASTNNARVITNAKKSFKRGSGKPKHTQNITNSVTNAEGSAFEPQNKIVERPPRPTHFLSLPLGQHPELRTNVWKFQDELLRLQGSPNEITNLHPSIIINPRRLHLTLGVMALRREEISEVQDGSETHKTVESALDLLRSLQPQLAKEGPVQIPLERLGAFGTKKGARVLWVSPSEHAVAGENQEQQENREKLSRICNLVDSTFRKAGYVVDKRALKLHCTLINTSHRKPLAKRHLLFSYEKVLESRALREIQVPGSPDVEVVQHVATESGTATPNLSTIQMVAEVNMGSYDVSEIQLCVMGSHGPEDEYVSVGGVSLKNEP